MIQRRLRLVKWLSMTPAVGVCTLCSWESKVPMSALRTSAEAQASLQEQFDRHKCEPADSGQVDSRVNVCSLDKTPTRKSTKRRTTAKKMMMTKTTRTTMAIRSERYLTYLNG
jgi:hypothetical protein